MINKNLEVKYHNGSITEKENKTFFKEMTQKEMWNLQDKILNALWDKGYSARSMAKNAENRILMNWIKEHSSF